MTMTPDTRAALRASIVKWEQNVAQTYDKHLTFGTAQCPLCALFNPPGPSAKSDCHGCPVFARTGVQYCEGTPYEAVIEHRAFNVNPFVSDELRELMQAELDFLRSLDDEPRL